MEEMALENKLWIKAFLKMKWKLNDDESDTCKNLMTT